MKRNIQNKKTTFSFLAHKARFGNICGGWGILYVANEVLFPFTSSRPGEWLFNKNINYYDIALNIASHKAIHIKMK